jgi:hypothetical protein
MHDPFPFPPSPWLSKAIQPFADYFHFTTLPLHIHEVLGSFLGYTFINIVVAPILSKWLFPVRYTKLSPEKKINWDVHVVSLVQSTTINILALWVMFTDEERKNMDWRERVWGYTGAAGMIQGMAAGYFLWDLMVTVQHLKVFGPGMLAHAISALVVFSFGFVSYPPLTGAAQLTTSQRPFVNFYGCTFILYELSSPFLNFHWFFDKLDMTGSKAQLYNGFMLLFTFFSCRLVWGTYQSVRVYQDVWAALHHKPTEKLVSEGGVMRFAGEEYCPLWLAFAYLGSNVILNTLNFYWFGKMIETLRKRFQSPQGGKRKEKAPIATRSTGSNGAAKTEIDETEVRRRKGVEEAEDMEAIS